MTAQPAHDPLTDLAVPRTTSAVLQRAAWLAPDVEAVVCGKDRVTYADLANRVARLRRALRALGVRPGDHVALCLGNGTRWVELFFAVTAERAVVVPVNTRYRADELAFCLAQSRSRFLFTAARVQSTDVLGLLAAIAPGFTEGLDDPALPDLRGIVLTEDASPAGGAYLPWADLLVMADATDPDSGEPIQDDPDQAGPNDVAVMQYTSGTTSRPKGALLTHGSVCVDALVSGSRMGLRAGDRFHSVRPFFHVAGSTLTILACAQQLATAVTMTRFEAGEALQVMEVERCTHFSGNDTIALMLLDHPDRPARQLALRGAWVAASSAVVERVIDELGATEAVVGYGLSEASPNVAQSAWYEPRDVRISTAMRPQPGVRVRIHDVQSDALCPVGVAGEIQVHGWNVMTGYHREPEVTASTFTADGWLRTGDLGRLDTTGRLTFVGRAKETIRVGGENVAPAEIEDLLHRHPDIRQAVVVGVADPRLVEVPFAFVVLRDGRQASADGLIAWTKERISGFKVPRYVHLVDTFDDLAMTASSKVQKTELTRYAASLIEVSP